MAAKKKGKKPNEIPKHLEEKWADADFEVVRAPTSSPPAPPTSFAELPYDVDDDGNPLPPPEDG